MEFSTEEGQYARSHAGGRNVSCERNDRNLALKRGCGIDWQVISDFGC